MKILVIDDNATHLDAAKAQFVDHELVVAQTYDEGQRLVLTERYDAVLVDLLMPASAQKLPRGHRLAGEEMPVGVFLALLAAKSGAKYVAVLTDCDHHQHPASACFDPFNEDECDPTPFMVEGARVLLTNNGWWLMDSPPHDLTRRRTDEEYKADASAYVRVKDWRAMLDYLTTD